MCENKLGSGDWERGYFAVGWVGTPGLLGVWLTNTVIAWNPGSDEKRKESLVSTVRACT